MPDERRDYQIKRLSSGGLSKVQIECGERSQAILEGSEECSCRTTGTTMPTGFLSSWAYFTDLSRNL